MSSSKIRVGIIGAGGWPKYGHIPALRTLDDFEVVAVSSRSKKTAESLAAAFEIRHAFDDLRTSSPIPMGTLW
jgi:predicted dehydrogenase